VKGAARAVAAVALLGIPFAATSIVAGVVGLLVSPLYGTRAYPKNLLRASDKQAAALLGFDGRATISAECGASECKLCRAVCALLNMIDNGHCEGASRREGKIA